MYFSIVDYATIVDILPLFRPITWLNVICALPQHIIWQKEFIFH